jgi:hypothetical protein
MEETKLLFRDEQPWRKMNWLRWKTTHRRNWRIGKKIIQTSEEVSEGSKLASELVLGDFSVDSKEFRGIMYRIVSLVCISNEYYLLGG